MATDLHAAFDARLSTPLRARLPRGLAEPLIFVLKFLWAALFGILFLIALVVTQAIWQPDWALSRYDALLIYALTVQGLMLWLKLESWEEAKVIFLFHLTGTVMEIFKVNAGSWSYPQPAVMQILGVPLFSGFMYASVGSTIARLFRLFRVQLAPYPPFWATVLLAAAIYVNFFAHHFIWDSRYLLFAATVLLFARTRMWFFTSSHAHWVPLPLAILACSFALWMAENIGTWSETWVYAGQRPWQMVSLHKMGSWYLLLYVSFVTVTLVYRDLLRPEKLRKDGVTGFLEPAE